MVACGWGTCVWCRLARVLATGMHVAPVAGALCPRDCLGGATTVLDTHRRYLHIQVLLLLTSTYTHWLLHPGYCQSGAALPRMPQTCSTCCLSTHDGGCRGRCGDGARTDGEAATGLGRRARPVCELRQSSGNGRAATDVVAVSCPIFFRKFGVFTSPTTTTTRQHRARRQNLPNTK